MALSVSPRLSPPSFASLPDELIVEIFRYLPIQDLLNARAVCKEWKQIASDDILWAELFFKIYPHKLKAEFYFDTLVYEYGKLTKYLSGTYFSQENTHSSPVTSCTAINDRWITGHQNGEVIVWQKNKAIHAYKLPENPIVSVDAEEATLVAATPHKIWTIDTLNAITDFATRQRVEEVKIFKNNLFYVEGNYTLRWEQHPQFGISTVKYRMVKTPDCLILEGSQTYLWNTDLEYKQPIEPFKNFKLKLPNALQKNPKTMSVDLAHMAVFEVVEFVAKKLWIVNESYTHEFDVEHLNLDHKKYFYVFKDAFIFATTNSEYVLLRNKSSYVLKDFSAEFPLFFTESSITGVCAKTHHLITHTFA